MKRLMIVGTAICASLVLMTAAGAEPTVEEAKAGSGVHFLETNGHGTTAQAPVPVPVVAGESERPWLERLVGPSRGPATTAVHNIRSIPSPYAPYKDVEEDRWAARLYRTLGTGVAVGAGVGAVAGGLIGAHVGGAFSVVGLGLAGASAGGAVGGLGALFVLRYFLQDARWPTEGILKDSTR